MIAFEFLIYVSILFSIIYFINIVRFIAGLIKTTVFTNNTASISISVIIAVKNGENSICKMLDSLLNQNYSGNMEFVIVDDNSTDNTKLMINDYLHKDPRFKYISSDLGSSKLSHKKRAIDAGIKCSEYEYLLFTDIDCIIQKNWIASMAKCFQNNINYVVGHAYVNDRKSVLNKFQRVDLFMLLFAARSMISLGSPWASIGQNQAYTKKLYNKCKGFESLSSYLQGDDSLFLQLAIKNGANVRFNEELDSYVISRTEKTWWNLLLQRGRWSGDANVMWKFNLPFYFAALSTWILSISIISLVFLNYFQVVFLLLILKLIFEISFYRLGMIKFHQQVQYLDFIIWSIIHPIYVFIMGLVSFFNFKWKGIAVK